MNSENTQKLIALLTDFGTSDYFVGAMKGTILSISANAKIIDITHEIEPQNVRAAGFTLRACYENFPAKTVFVAVVDPGVGSSRRAILVETVDYYFVAPDNGLLSFIFNQNVAGKTHVRVFELTNEKYFAANVSKTFHGRDVFAPVAAHLANGVAAKQFGREIKDFVSFEETRPRKINEGKIEAEVIHVDHFGNLITNLRKEDLPEYFYLEIGNKAIGKLRKFFAESENENEIFTIFGSAGFLEIVAFRASAENILNVKAGEKIIVKTHLRDDGEASND